jgi:hypothetical protein
MFLFDHSCGHDKQREDGLNVERMSKNFGGKQSYLHSSLIREANGYLGPFEVIGKLRVENTQTFMFQQSDSGPFWLSDQEKEEQWLDK